MSVCGLAMQFARAHISVLGLEIDAAKVDVINQGQSYIRHIPQTASLSNGTGRLFQTSIGCLSQRTMPV
jgi:UDP-N-acetyl-D-mannosaminuronate dehydrogenase